MVAAAFVMTEMAEAIKGAYGVVKEINAFIDEHIDELKASANATTERVGRVLEGVKYGFGIGYIVPMAILATGQLLLGNPLAVASTVLTTVTFTNPLAMTCAAVGAIYFGWTALSDDERQSILDKLSHGLNVGIELIKSAIGFVITKTKELMTSDNALELKQFIAGAAESFGRTLADITGSIADRIKGAFDVVARTSGDAVDKTKTFASDAYLAATDTGGKLVNTVRGKLDKPDSK